MYYATCDSIDDHNHSHPDSLQLEWKIGTLNFDMQMNSTLLGMMIVNTLLVCSKAIWITELEKNFFIKISDLIDRYLSSTKRGGIEGWYHNKLWASRKMQNMWWKKNIYVFHCLCVDSQDDSPLGAKLHGCATHQKESFYWCPPQVWGLRVSR